MNRRNFFRRLGTTAAAAAIIPTVLADVKPEPEGVEWCGWEELPLDETARCVKVIHTHTRISEAHPDLNGGVFINLDTPLYVNDLIAIPPLYTNVNNDSIWMVKSQHYMPHIASVNIYTIIPLSVNDKITKPIQIGTQLYKV